MESTINIFSECNENIGMDRSVKTTTSGLLDTQFWVLGAWEAGRGVGGMGKGKECLCLFIYLYIILRSIFSYTASLTCGPL